MVQVLFFAQLREQLQCSELCIDHFDGQTVTQLLDYLIAQQPHWAEFLNNRKLLVAVNQTLVKVTHHLQSGDEVAFFPPVTGG